MKKVICMVIALATALTMTGCHREETEVENIDSGIRPTVQLMVQGVQPWETRRECRIDNNGRIYFSTELTLKGWSANNSASSFSQGL